MPDRWSFEDVAGAKGGYCHILLDGMDLCISQQASALVEILNAADHWRNGPSDGSGPERLEDAVDAFNRGLDGPINAPGMRGGVRTERICNQIPTRIVQRIAEAAQSWLLLRDIESRFGEQDGAVGRDMINAESRLRAAIAEMPEPPQ